MRPAQFTLRGAFVAAILIIQSCFAQQTDRVCHAPRYKVASLDTKKDKPGEVNISVSIAPKNVNLKGLFALACQLRRDYPKSDLMRVDIFNDFGAAKRDDLPIGSDPGPNHDDTSKYIASYYFDQAKGREHLLLWGDVRNCASNIVIELPSKRPRSACDY